MDCFAEVTTTRGLLLPGQAAAVTPMPVATTPILGAAHCEQPTWEAVDVKRSSSAPGTDHCTLHRLGAELSTGGGDHGEDLSTALSLLRSSSLAPKRLFISSNFH